MNPSLTMNLCPGSSVGAIIKNTKNEFLCLYRLKHPRGLAFIAGHIDLEDNGPTHALVREVKEESGLTVLESALILNKVFLNTCSRLRPSDNLTYDGHEWFVYDVTLYKGRAKLMEPTKHKFVKWMSAEEIHDYILREDCDPAWFQMILPMIALMK